MEKNIQAFGSIRTSISQSSSGTLLGADSNLVGGDDFAKLIIMDRGMDLKTPLMHDLTFLVSILWKNRGLPKSSDFVNYKKNWKSICLFKYFLTVKMFFRRLSKDVEGMHFFVCIIQYLFSNFIFKQRKTTCPIK